MYMVWSPGAVSVEFRDVPQRHCFSVFHTLLARYTEVKYKLNNLFFPMNIKFDELLSEMAMFYKESLIYLCQHNTLKEFSFSYIHATPRKTQRNKMI